MDKDPPVFLKETTSLVVELQDIHIAYLIMIKTFASLTFVEHQPADSSKTFISSVITEEIAPFLLLH